MMASGETARKPNGTKAMTGGSDNGPFAGYESLLNIYGIWRPGSGNREMRHAGWLPDDVAPVHEEVDAGHE